MSETTTVFVYGTLLPGERNAQVASRGGEFTAQPASLRGFRLVHLHPEGYPGLLHGEAKDMVYGAALTYAPQDWEQALRWLDELEGIDEVPPLYTRELVELQLESGEAVAGWVYIYARLERLERAGAVPVPSGNWRSVEGR